MKKITITFGMSIFILFLLLLTGCSGANGNPFELTGNWEYEYDERNDSNSTYKHDYELEIENDGSFTMKYQRTGGTNDHKATITGSVYGNPTGTPKQVFFTVKTIKVSVGSNSTSNADSNRIIPCEYYIQWINGKQYLVLFGSDFSEEETDTNVDVTVNFTGKFKKQ